VRGHVFEFEHALGIGALVNAKDHGAQGFEMGGHGFVRGQHELLNEAMGDVARSAGDAGHFSEFVEFEERLGLDRSRWSHGVHACD